MDEKKKTPIGSAKGADYERIICRKLSLWVSGLTREDVFWRSAMSGGKATLGRRKGVKGTSAHAGDITATHQLGHLLREMFYIDCKFYKSLQLDLVIFDRLGVLEYIWHEPLRQAAAEGLEPLVIAKQNRQADLVFTTTRGLKLLTPGFESTPAKQAIFPRYDLNIITLQSMLTRCDFAKIRATQKESQ